MKLPVFIIVITLFPLYILAAGNDKDTLPYIFKAGETARAASVNENFNYLLQIIMKAEARIGQAEDKIDSLKDLSAMQSDSIAKIKNNLYLPIGTIIGSILNPEKFKQFFASDSTLWILADSSTASAEFFAATGKSNIPDLRGVFLRGINNDRGGAFSDPDGEREAGSSQADIFKNHNHSWMQYSSGATNIGTWGVLDNTDRGHVTSYSGSTGGNETRPKNVAVYWYIKVK